MNNNRDSNNSTTRKKPNKKPSCIQSKVLVRNKTVDKHCIDVSDQVQLYNSGPGKFQQASDIVRAIVSTNKSCLPENFVINSSQFNRRVVKKIESFTEGSTRHWFTVQTEDGTTPNLSQFMNKSDIVHDVSGFDGWTIVNNMTTSKYIMEYVTKKKRRLICAIMKRVPVEDNEEIHKETSSTMSSLPKLKPKQKRGKKTNGISSSYCFFGTRLDPLGNPMFGDYVFKEQVSKEQKQKANEGVKTTAMYMEQHAKSILEKIAPQDLAYFNNLSKTVDLPAIQTVFPQLAIGCDYISCCHVDQDIYYTVVAASPNVYDNKLTEDVLQYFIFPEHHTVVPLRQGNVLMFNPMVAHCATNPLVDKTHIYSAYVSRKMTVGTVLLQNNH